MQQKSLKDTVTALVDAHDMLPAAGQVPVVLMVSGGSDSVALARLLPALYPQHSYTILHINHQLRGEAAEKDELFVIHLAQELELPCEVRHIDISALAAKTGDNLEQAGRAARYREANTLLDTLCEQAGVELSQGRIVTAHTLDDRVETFFMRTIVGGGASGLSSIPQVNGRVIRPLLACTREGLQIHAGTWREDATNTDTSKLRAFVRHELIPLAKTRNPELLHTVERTLDVLGSEAAFVEQQALELLVRASESTMTNSSTTHEPLARSFAALTAAEGGECGWDAGELRLDAGTLFSADSVLVRRVIREACRWVMPQMERITYEHIANISDNGKRVGFVTDIPGAKTVANEYGTLVFRRLDSTKDPVGSMWSLTLDEGVSHGLPDGRAIGFSRLEPQQFADDPVGFARTYATATRVFIDGDALAARGGTLTVGGLRTGDRMCPLGMNGRHKLVSDLLVDCKVPRRKRAELLKVCTQTDGEDQMVWLIDVCLDDRYKVSAETTSMFSIIVS